MKYFNTLKTVLFKPTEFFEGMLEKAAEISNPWLFVFLNYLILAVFYAAFGCLGVLAQSGELKVKSEILLLIAVGVAFGFFLLMPILGLIGLPIGAAFTHLGFRIFGAKEGYSATLRIVAYSTAPQIVSWLPFIGSFAGIYSLILTVIGGMKVHKLSTGRSIGGVLLGGFIAFILVALLIGCIVLGVLLATGALQK